jgi:hypothetical protein
MSAGKVKGGRRLIMREAQQEYMGGPVTDQLKSIIEKASRPIAAKSSRNGGGTSLVKTISNFRRRRVIAENGAE